MEAYGKQIKKTKEKIIQKVYILEKSTCSNEQETIYNSKTLEAFDQKHDDAEEYDRKECPSSDMNTNQIQLMILDMD